jgi:hypothetical protein
MDFPSNPPLDDTYTYAGKTWEWDGEKWNIMWSATGFLSEDPVIIYDDPYLDDVSTISFDPNNLPQITKN